MFTALVIIAAVVIGVLVGSHTSHAGPYADAIAVTCGAIGDMQAEAASHNLSGPQQQWVDLAGAISTGPCADKPATASDALATARVNEAYNLLRAALSH